MSDHTTNLRDQVIAQDGRHVRVLGPPGSGKTALLLERFRRAERAAVVTYTRESRDSLTDALLEKGSARFGRVPVYTYHRLAAEVLGAVCPGVGLRVIDELEEAVLLRRLLRRVEDRLASDYRHTLHSSAFQDKLLGAVNSMLQVGIGPEHREALVAAAADPRLRDLLTVYFEFWAYLQSHGYYTFYDAAWRAASLAAADGALNPLRDADVVLIDDFNDVDAGQYALIKGLVPPNGGATLCVFGDPTGARFRSRGTTDRYLLDVFAADYEPRDVLMPAGCANGEVLGGVVDRALDSILGEAGARDFARGPADGARNVDVCLAIADDEVAEASFVAGRAAELVASGRYRPVDMAVAVRDVRRYETVLATAFRQRGLILETARHPQQPFEFFVSSLLRMLTDPADDAARSAFAQSTFFGALCGALGVEESADSPVEEVRASIHRATEDRNGAFDLVPLVERFLRPVLASKAGGEASGPDAGGSDLLAFLGGLAEEWRTYSGVVGDAKGRCTIREYLAVSRALAAGVSGESAGRARSGRVGLYSIHELSSRRFPVVFVAGCSELVFPSLPRGEDYVPHDALQDLLRGVVTDRPVELSAARPAADFLRDEHALMLTALSRAGDRLVLTSPRQLGGQATPAPSRVLAAIPDDAVRRDVGRRPSVVLRFAAVAAAGDEPPASGPIPVELWHRAPPEARTVPREHTLLSPSSLRTFTFCPRKYFYVRLLKIEGERSPAVAFGTAFHDLMNRLSEKNRTHEELSAAIRSSRLNELIEEIVAGSRGFADAPLIEAEAARHHLRDMAYRLLDLDGARSDGYRTESTEAYLRFEHGGSRFHGVADRIDKTAAGARVVIDYKTGRIPKTGKTIRKRALAGFDKPEERLWQVPIYARGAATEGGDDPEAFCYYVLRPDGDDVVVGVAVGEQEDAGRVAQAFGVAESRIGFMSPVELDESLDEAAAVAGELFADRAEFLRTEDRERCSRCEFRGVCERTT
jgi:superfamily I DNA/RNA helicase